MCDAVQKTLNKTCKTECLCGRGSCYGICRTWLVLNIQMATTNNIRQFCQLQTPFHNWQRLRWLKRLTLHHCCYVNAQNQSSSYYKVCRGRDISYANACKYIDQYIHTSTHVYKELTSYKLLQSNLLPGCPTAVGHGTIQIHEYTYPMCSCTIPGSPIGESSGQWTALQKRKREARATWNSNSLVLHTYHPWPKYVKMPIIWYLHIILLRCMERIYSEFSMFRYSFIDNNPTQSTKFGLRRKVTPDVDREDEERCTSN